MKRILTLAAVIIMCLSLWACGSKEEIQHYEKLLNEQEQFIQELENELQNLQDTMNIQDESIRQQSQQISELQKQLQEYENTLNEYGWMIRNTQEGSFDSVISYLEQMQEEARKAELEAKGIAEVLITLENWDQYFEYVPYGYVYIKNAFNEPTHLNMVGGLKLKDEYTMAEGSGTKVNFEMETYPETRTCSVDFTTGTFEYGDVVKVGSRTETTTVRFSDSHSGGVVGFGSIDQVNNDKGNQITCDVTVEAISKMLRVEGILYIHQN